MEYQRLGRSGLKVSRLCLGCMTYGSSQWRDWVLDEEPSRPFIKRALEAGINFFDTSNFYSLGASETVVGNLLGEYARRDEVVIASKVGLVVGKQPNSRGLSRKHIVESIDATLTRLKTDYLDLYYIHRLDPDTPMEETLDALDSVVRAGKVLYLGASSMHAWQFAKLNYLARMNGQTEFVAMQNFYNLIYREEEREMIPLCADLGVGLVPWSPLARGYLARPAGSDATTRSQNDPIATSLGIGTGKDPDILAALTDMAKARGLSNAQLALAWVLNKPEVASPIIGASRMAQLDDALAALEVELSADEMAALESAYEPRAVSGHQ